MANMADGGAGGGGGIPGPYWRRRLGTTLPGEFTADQLNRINMIRKVQGLPPVGGKRGFNTPGAHGPVNPAVAGAMGPEGAGATRAPSNQWRDILLQGLMNHTQQGAAGGDMPMATGPHPHSFDEPLQQGMMPGGPMQGPGAEVDPGFDHGYAGGDNVGDIRERILRRIGGHTQPGAGASMGVRALQQVAHRHRILPRRVPAARRRMGGQVPY